MLYLSINYDFFSNKIYYKYIDNEGKRKSEIISPEIEYYIFDKTGKSILKDIYGNSVVKRTTDEYNKLKNILDSGSECCEADISGELKFLNKIYLNEKIDFQQENFNICKIDIEVQSSDEIPLPAEAKKYPINLISISVNGEMTTFGIKEYTGEKVKNYYYISEEKNMLEEFISFFRKKKIDILTGWYINQFDLPYLINRCKYLNVDYNRLSPFNIVVEKKKYNEYIIYGISQLDYLELYKKFTYGSRESYSLHSISMAELQEGKLKLEGTVNNEWKDNWNNFVEYNIQDVNLVDKLDNKLRFIELALIMSFDALIPFENIFATLPLHTGYILRYLHKNNMVMPQRKKQEDEVYPGAYVFAEQGIYKNVISYDVESEYPSMIMRYNISPETLRKDPKDFTNLIKTPLSDYKKWETINGEKEYGGIYYDRSKKGILNLITEEVFTERKKLNLKKEICKYKIKNKSLVEISKILKINEDKMDELCKEIENERGNSGLYDIRQKARKIQLNSLYGAIANKHFHLYNIHNVVTITLGGQTLIKYLVNNINDYLKNYFYKNKKYFGIIDEKNKLDKPISVIIDTDSVYLCLNEIIEKLGLKFKNNDEFRNWSLNFDREFLTPFFKKILDIDANKYNVESIINFKREKIISDMIVIAKKRYIVFVIDEKGHKLDKPEISSTGVEIVRTDTPKFCRKKIEETVEKIINSNKDETIEFMKKIHKEFRNSEIGDIANPTGISDYKKYAKSMEFYEKNGLQYPKGCPIHVRAAINYNYLIDKYKLKLQKVSNGTKMRYIYVSEQNEINSNVIGFIGNYPDKFKEIFKVDYKIQWEKTFQNVIQRIFEAIGWGEISLDNSLKKWF